MNKFLNSILFMATLTMLVYTKANAEDFVVRPTENANPVAVENNLGKGPIENNEEGSSKKTRSFQYEGEHDYELGFFLAPHFENHTLSGNGFKGSLKTQVGTHARFFGQSYFFNKDMGLAFNLERSSVDFKTPSSLSPDKLESKRQNIEVYYSYFNLLNNQLNLSLGYKILKQEATVTTPNALVSSFNLKGILLGLGYKTNIGPSFIFENLQFKFENFLMIPLKLTESNKTTGIYKDGFSETVTFSFSSQWSESIEYGLGLKFLYEKIRFNGTGNNGTSLGQIKYISTSFPIELRFLL